MDSRGRGLPLLQIPGYDATLYLRQHAKERGTVTHTGSAQKRHEKIDEELEANVCHAENNFSAY